MSAPGTSQRPGSWPSEGPRRAGLGRYRRDLRLTNEYLDLVGEGIDVALRFSTRRLRDSTLNARKLGPSYVQLYASPSYVARQGMPRAPRDSERHTWVVHRHAATLRLEGGGEAVLVDTRAKGRVECNDFAFLREALLRGWGIGILGLFQAEPYVASGKLVRVLPKWWSLVSSLWAISGRDLGSLIERCRPCSTPSPRRWGRIRSPSARGESHAEVIRPRHPRGFYRCKLPRMSFGVLCHEMRGHRERRRIGAPRPGVAR